MTTDVHEPEIPAAATVETRAAGGRAARKDCSRSSIGTYSSEGRPDPVSLLQSQDATRLPDLVPVRYGRMLVSPFTFYRGAALIMASDLSRGPRTSLHAQLCGDAHLSNFGGFASPERRLVFDINDFDETNPGPFEWDLKRLVTSMVVAARDRGFTTEVAREIALSTAAAYRGAMAHLAGMANLDVWYVTLDIEKTLESLQVAMSKKAVKRTQKDLAKARTHNSLQAANKLTEVVDGQRRFINNPPVVQRVADMLLADGNVDAVEVAERIGASGSRYDKTLQPDRSHLLSQFTFVDLARKVVGVGSVGTRAWVALFQGRDPEDLLILQIKEAQASVLEAFTQPSVFGEHGERVVQGQRTLQSASDIFLGWSQFDAGNGDVTDYYVRQLRDWKVSAEVDLMEAEALKQYGTLCAWALAKGHARSGDRIAISAYCGQSDAFDKAMLAFAESYADQNERDYAELKQAADSGRIQVVTGV